VGVLRGRLLMCLLYGIAGDAVLFLFMLFLGANFVR
jgi:hypothetical protein